VLRPVPLPPTYQPLKSAAQIEPTARPAVTVMATPVVATRPETAPPSDVRAEIVRFETTTANKLAAGTTSSVYVAMATAPAQVAPETPRKSGPRDAAATSSDDAAAAPRIARDDETSAMVQFAATASEESARSFWQDLVHRFPAVLGGREPVVVRFEHGGTVFWRVRAEGFASLSEAQTLCARMRADGQACFVPRS
jgi:hypothetical protein